MGREEGGRQRLGRSEYEGAASQDVRYIGEGLWSSPYLLEQKY